MTNWLMLLALLVVQRAAEGRVRVPASMPACSCHAVHAAQDLCALGNLLLVLACAGRGAAPSLDYVTAHFSRDFCHVVAGLLAAGDGAAGRGARPCLGPRAELLLGLRGCTGLPEHACPEVWGVKEEGQGKGGVWFNHQTTLCMRCVHSSAQPRYARG